MSVSLFFRVRPRHVVEMFFSAPIVGVVKVLAVTSGRLGATGDQDYQFVCFACQVSSGRSFFSLLFFVCFLRYGVLVVIMFLILLFVRFFIWLVVVFERIGLGFVLLTFVFEDALFALLLFPSLFGGGDHPWNGFVPFFRVASCS